jgi:hypothetical protein
MVTPRATSNKREERELCGSLFRGNLGRRFFGGEILLEIQMTILHKLASSLKRRDELPNQLSGRGNCSN